MAQVTGVVEAYSQKYGWSIMVNDKWYKTKPEWAPKEDLRDLKGCEVTFDDGGKNYIKNFKVVGKSSGGTSSGPTRTGGGKTWSNLGVELGHASNLAMRMIEQSDNPGDVGSAEYWKTFATYTEQAYKVMKTLRDKYEKGGTPVAEAPKEVKVLETPPSTPEGEPVSDVSDLF